MRKKDFTDREETVLSLLAQRGKKTYYELYTKEHVGSRSTIWNVLTDLKSQGFISKKKEPKGRKKANYSLTLMGLFLAFDNDLVESIDKIADRFKERLPLIFGKWRYFREQGVEGVAEKHLLNVMKVCAFEYRRFIEDLEQNHETEDQRYFQLLGKIRETWKKERAWAARITNLFLYEGLETEHLMELSRDTLRKVGYSCLTLDETSKLNSAIGEDNDLRLYRLMLQRKDAQKYLRRAKHYGYASPELLRMPEKTEEKVIERLLWKLLKPDSLNPYDEIANAVYKEEYFDAYLKLAEQYVEFPFEDPNEATEAVPQFLWNLIRMSNPRLNLIMTNAERKHEKLPDDVKEYIDEANLEILSAGYFYDLDPEPVPVWDQTFYRIRPHEKRLEELRNEPKMAKAVALKWAQQMLKDLTRRKAQTT